MYAIDVISHYLEKAGLSEEYISELLVRFLDEEAEEYYQLFVKKDETDIGFMS